MEVDGEGPAVMVARLTEPPIARIPGMDRRYVSTDDALEQVIRAAYDAAVDAWRAGDREAAREHFADMAALIRLRSPEQIERMERERGLKRRLR